MKALICNVRMQVVFVVHALAYKNGLLIVFVLRVRVTINQVHSDLMFIFIL